MFGWHINNEQLLHAAAAAQWLTIYIYAGCIFSLETAYRDCLFPGIERPKSYSIILKNITVMQCHNADGNLLFLKHRWMSRWVPSIQFWALLSWPFLKYFNTKLIFTAARYVADIYLLTFIWCSFIGQFLIQRIFINHEINVPSCTYWLIGFKVYNARFLHGVHNISLSSYIGGSWPVFISDATFGDDRFVLIQYSFISWIAYWHHRHHGMNHTEKSYDLASHIIRVYYIEIFIWWSTVILSLLYLL
jgi:hypothetical protein